jgi:hypothetical protein
MPVLADFGLVVDVPPGWDGRITRRGDGSPTQLVGPSTVNGLAVTSHPVVHLANFPLPEVRADFGSDVVETMGPDDVFAVLFEYGPAAVGTPLFATVGFPQLDGSRFTPDTLQRGIPGQAGFQTFFQVSRRAFTLYAVVGSYARRAQLVPRLDAVLATMRIAAPVGPPTG